MNAETLSLIREGGLLYIVLLIAICMHEFGHAFVADKLGDRLPRLEGRVSLNPLAHIDMMGTVILPILTIALSVGSGFPLVFGWGKPVRVFLDNPMTRTKVDLLSTAGGLAMNLVLAAISAILMGVILLLATSEFAVEAAKVAQLSVFVNCALFVINMLPVPPLDGAHFLKYAFRISDEVYARVAAWGIVILLVLINVPQTSRLIGLVMSYLAMLFMLLTKLVLLAGGN